MATAPSSVPAARGPVAYGSYVDEVLGYRQTVGGVASVYYPHGNHLYSVAALTNAAGQVVEKYTYTAYGKQTITSPTGVVRQKSAVEYNRGFTGYVADVETGLLYARSRMYSPTLGRFVGRDSLGYVDGESLYAAYFIPNNTDDTGNRVTVYIWDRDSDHSGHGSINIGGHGGVYFSFWPNGYAGPLTGDVAAKTHTYDEDMRSEGNRDPTFIELDGLDEAAMNAEVEKIKSEIASGTLKFNVYGRNCATLTARVLWAGVKNQPKPTCPCGESVSLLCFADETGEIPGIDRPSTLEDLAWCLFKTNGRIWSCD